jgi:acetoin utilization deacetylase AcuC-like enzyme
MLYFSHPASLEHDPRAQMPTHPDTPERLLAIERALGERDWLGWERHEAPPASEEELRLIHSAGHVENVRELCLSGGGAIDPDTYVGEASYRAALHAAGGACAMTRTLLDRADVLFVSIHEAGIFPGSGSSSDFGSGEGEGYTVNLPVPGGSEEELWLSLVEHIVVPIATEFAPGLVLVSAGFDAHRADPLASCRLEAGSFAAMARHVRELAAGLGVPLGLVLEGGYEPLALADSVLATMAALGGEGEAESAAPEAMLTSRAAAGVARYWPL